jgi:preprotein translocase subunit SecE
MSKISEAIGKVRTFLEEVRTELKKCAWPTRAELLESTMVVIISVLILGTYVGVSDTVVVSFLKLIIK